MTKKIVIVSTSPSLFMPNDLETEGMGGTETLLINLSKKLAEKYSVTVFCNVIEETVWNGVKFLYKENVLKYLKENKTDILIVLRDTVFVNELDIKSLNIGKIILWCHDFAYSPIHAYMNKIVNKVDTIICVSKWHKEDILKMFTNVNKDKIKVIYNGVDESLFNFSDNKIPGKLVYTSTPYRGLEHALNIFPTIRKNVPNATLHIFSGLKLYKDGQQDNFSHLYERAKSMKNVYYHGIVSRKELSKHLKESELMFYPNTYPETFCCAAAENLMCGTPVITSKLGALPEVIHSSSGFLSDKEIGSNEWCSDFIIQIETLLLNPDLLKEVRENCKKINWGLESFYNDWFNLLEEK
jgi:glycosyltransferase involved in cell wall biosynthesis